MQPMWIGRECIRKNAITKTKEKTQMFQWWFSIQIRFIWVLLTFELCTCVRACVCVQFFHVMMKRWRKFHRILYLMIEFDWYWIFEKIKHHYVDWFEFKPIVYVYIHAVVPIERQVFFSFHFTITITNINNSWQYFVLNRQFFVLCFSYQ